MSTTLPLMPPLFMAHAQVVLDIVAGRLQALAVELEVDAALEAWRMSRLTEADSGEVGRAVRRLLADLGGQGRVAWEDLSREDGTEALIDPLGGNVHLLLGAADDLSQLFQTAATFTHLDPQYALRDPAGAARARQETLAMAINLVELFPEVGSIDPEGHRLASERTAARVADWSDLRRGDVPRWIGHVGAGFGLAWVTRGLLAGTTSTDAATIESSDSGLASTLNTVYEGLGDANHLPTETGPKDSRRRRNVLEDIEQRAAGLLEHRPPVRAAQP